MVKDIKENDKYEGMRWMSTTKILRKYWGYPAFRPLQEDIIHSVCAGRDTLGLMPTGGGKSVTFQVPALAMEGICLVITPLIALMRDQVDNLRRVEDQSITIYSEHGPAGKSLRNWRIAFPDNTSSCTFRPNGLPPGLFRGKATGRAERLPVGGG
ncbi:MAG: DEAD/DEAH box helicase [Parabacteroides merdae]